MGVQDRKMYTGIRELLEIPPEEPIFILRGQDLFAIPTLNFYAFQTSTRGGSQKWFDSLMKQIGEFEMFRDARPNRMKEPD